MITRDFDYENEGRRYNAGDIIRIKGDPDKNEADVLGIVAYPGKDGSFCAITADGYLGLAERVVTEPTGETFDLAPLFDRLRAGGFKAQPGDTFKVGDIVLAKSFSKSTESVTLEPAVVFYVFDNGDAASLFLDGMSLGAPASSLWATGETFDLAPMFEALRLTT